MVSRHDQVVDISQVYDARIDGRRREMTMTGRDPVPAIYSARANAGGRRRRRGSEQASEYCILAASTTAVKKKEAMPARRPGAPTANGQRP
jgi:hypothetical protein